MNYKKIGAITALLDVIEEAVGKKGYTVQEFEQVHPWGEKSQTGDSVAVRIVPVKESGTGSVRGAEPIGTVIDPLGTAQKPLSH